jgi:hypothetical protein
MPTSCELLAPQIKSPPDFFYFANPKKVACVFHLLRSLPVGAEIQMNPFAGTSALCVRVEKNQMDDRD